MIKSYYNKILLIIFIIVVLSIIITSFYIKTSNIGKSVQYLEIKNSDRSYSLQEILNPQINKYIAFFSFECPSCKELINNKTLSKHFFLINVDFNANVPANYYQLAIDNTIEIFYLPYFVKVDTSFKIIKEYKISEIEELINSGGSL